jgi:HAD superfamily hydrolase (TIGR01509 family)
MLNLNLKNKKALLFDVDGTIADTMPAHNKAYELAFHLNNVPFDIELHKTYAPFGGNVLMRETVEAIGYGAQAHQIIKDKQALLGFCLDRFMRPNTELINFIKQNVEKYYIAFVSNGRRTSIQQVLEKLGLLYYADYITTSDILGAAKPSPEAYNYTMLMLGVNPDEVITFEDNEIGITAATRAKIKDIIKVNTEDFRFEKL